MPIPAGVSRAVIGGTVTDESEIFEFGFWLDEAPDNQDDADALAQDVWNSFILEAAPGLDPLIKNDSNFTSCKVYCYPDGGPSASLIGTATAAPEGGTGAGSLPLQACLVVTLLTGAAGRRNRGRMYLPANGTPLAANHEFGSGQVDAAVDGIHDWFAGLVAASHTPIVLSQVAGTHRPVTTVRGDSKVDIQRRRADSAPAGHVHSVDL